MNYRENILAGLDWDEGLSMPVANADNKLLEDEVQRKQQIVTGHKNELDETEDRVFAMGEHLKNVRQELVHTQNNIFKQTQKLEQMKSQMNWDQQALEAWLEESARKDEDSMALQKYTRQDESKIKELMLTLERMTEESQHKRRQLDHETTSTIVAQMELDKTAEDFRKAHAERQDLIQQWEFTIEQMQRRDKEMDLLALQLARIKIQVRHQEEAIRDKQQFLQNEIENNQEQEKKIFLAERTLGKLRTEYQELDSQRFQFSDELETLKRTVDRTAVDLETTRSRVTQLKKDVQDKTIKLKQAKDLRKALVEKLKVATESTLSAEERAAQMDEFLNNEEKRQKDLYQDLKTLRDINFKKQEELHDAQRNEKDVESSIQGSQATQRNLISKIMRLDTEALKQQEIIYKQDYTIQQLERRISRMQGEHSNEELMNLEKRQHELQEELNEKNNIHSVLIIQVKRLQDDVRRVTSQLEKTSGEKAGLTTKIEETILYNSVADRELKSVIKNKQDRMVDENIKKLEVKRLKDMLNSKSDDVLTQEKRRLQLETAMKERMQEIAIHKDMLVAQYRAADTERQQISAELHERMSKIDKLRKRYEILMISMAPAEGEESSQAYYVIKAAQEKEELQREGDKLDAQIRKAEKEIRALENTLKVMNGRNEQYRKSFNKITETSDEMDKKQQLDEQMRAVMDKYKYKRRQIRELQDDLQTMSTTLDNLNRDEDAYVGMIEEKKNKILQLNKDLDDQRAKLERVTKQRDIGLRELRDFNKSIMKYISEAVGQHPDMMEAVNMYFSQANLPAIVPSGTPGSSRSSVSSGHSSRTSSVRSLGSSQRSGSALQIGVRTPTSSRSSSSSSHQGPR
ncbi:hypothetical protein C0Q70_20887 [Pomacea canaliculata]|uniref:Coiled-coil domain-containing protein 39 n=1 Tax=Pomacea canaliculata TaxID=400727 RepID=A0A2T7NAZ2_POMCA|nr:hypothetical protein C0Q70_20887 [Pomacea canaliculata]